MEADDILSKATEQMGKALEHALHEFNTIHTGKASPAMVESIQIDAYGSSMRIQEVAAITTPDARTISIQPWDKSVMKEVEKAIQAANIGLNPIINGNNIICPIPELSGDRRKELVKMVHSLAESGKVGIRSARREAMDGLKKLEKEKLISEDDQKRYEKDVQSETDRFGKEIEQHLAAKEKELTQI